jgi:hypothetical protein
MENTLFTTTQLPIPPIHGMRLDPPTSTGGAGPGVSHRKPPADPRGAAKQTVTRVLH